MSDDIRRIAERLWHVHDRDGNVIPDDWYRDRSRYEWRTERRVGRTLDAAWCYHEYELRRGRPGRRLPRFNGHLRLHLPRPARHTLVGATGRSH